MLEIRKRHAFIIYYLDLLGTEIAKRVVLVYQLQERLKMIEAQLRKRSPGTEKWKFELILRSSDMWTDVHEKLVDSESRLKMLKKHEEMLQERGFLLSREQSARESENRITGVR